MSRRALPNTLLAVFAALTLGGIVLSLSTAPPEAVYQLQLAAKATMAAPSFVLTDTNTVAPLLAGLPAGTQQQLAHSDVVHIVYQAPDRVEDRTASGGHPVTLVVIGSLHFQNTAGRWYELPPRPSLGQSAAQVVLSPLRAAAGASQVVRRGGRYLFLPADLDRFTTMLLRSHVSQLSSVSVTAVVEGDYLTREHVTAVRQGSRLTIDFVFTSIGSAPPVVAPPASEVVHLPAGGPLR
jgi:hypothetical protein